MATALKFPTIHFIDNVPYNSEKLSCFLPQNKGKGKSLKEMGDFSIAFSLLSC